MNQTRPKPFPSSTPLLLSFYIALFHASPDHDYIGLPPIADEPILCLIWEQIALLQTGTLDVRSAAAASLVSLARDNDRYGKLIIKEGGVGPLLKLVKEGKIEGQESAAMAVGLLGRDAESVECMVLAGVCSVFSKVLKDAPMRIQAVVAWAVLELAAHYQKCQDLFAQSNVVRFLVSLLALETIKEHSKYTIVNHKANSIYQVLIASKNPRNEKFGFENENHTGKILNLNGSNEYRLHNVVASTIAMKAVQAKANSRSLTVVKTRDLEDSPTKANMKVMAARALWKLGKGNSPFAGV